ncbi:tetraacyldisaccharide 4'-kinase [Methylocystis heyeri]|uniref:Tetraacyldisaccharide 4'-kinase n=1 Tax=Methylocystis heyeri TaxID=391905 RepID=A0A6B8KK88_9HYPH|nr:tetraacyldisaccharide 4'-kinase [Methylocystis heyeri]QGM47013.1 tetraacyldisaccharide 4'-kinase [Methylocystis heyeri]
MRAPDFWGAPAGLRAFALSPLAALYAAAARARLARPAPRADLPVISIGGLTLGGDGKTPTALALTAMLKQLGERPFLSTRGYGRRRSAEGEPFVVDPARHDALTAGDEALLLARAAPTIVGADRIAAARLAAGLEASVLVLDDGLHSRRLDPDLSLLVVDAEYGAGNGFCPPAGPLRAPLAAQLARADALLLIGDGPAPGFGLDRRVMRARLEVDPQAAARLSGRSVFAFAGVGRPEKFKRTLERAGASVAGVRWFPDHHFYDAAELAGLALTAQKLGASPVTTEKDLARIEATAAFEAVAATLKFKEPDRVKDMLAEVLARARAGRGSRGE